MKIHTKQRLNARLMKWSSAAALGLTITTLTTSIANAAISEGAAKLISQGYTITDYQFTTEQQVTINTVKVAMLVHATVQPEKLASSLKQLKQIKISDAKFNLVSLAQNRTQTGLIELSAQLNSETSLTTLPAIYQFAEQRSTSGTLYKVSSITPYLSPDAKQQVANQMAQSLYQQASDYAATLGKGYRIAAANYRAPIYQNKINQRPMPVMLSMATRNAAADTTTPPMLTMKEQVSLTANVTFVNQGAK